MISIYKNPLASGKIILFVLLFSVLINSCTKLHETFRGDLGQAQVAGSQSSAAALLGGVYNSMEGPFTAPFDVFPLAELSTDEAIMPTRGGDWDDNGVWRAFHEQKWDADNVHIESCFNDLSGIVFAATDLLRYDTSKSDIAQSKLIRAWAMYWLLDFFDQVPYRDPGESVIQPARVMKDTAALNYIIKEIDSVKNDLPNNGIAYVANKYTALAILMKCYLNKAVYINRANPNHNPADMDSVISFADIIINSGQFHFTQNYFDNFAPDNTNIGSENIFTLLDQPQITNNNSVFFFWILVLHYNQGGINGAATLPDFYNRFSDADKRRQANYPTAGSPPNPGKRVTVGFFAGQQYNLEDDSPLTDLDGSPLIYVPQVQNIETGNNLRLTGIRPVKYAIDYQNYYSPDNDYVFLRFADVLLMKAEAILRQGMPRTPGIYGGNTADSIVNTIRTDPSRGVSSMHPVTLDSLFDERGRELWWENWRRQDMIRFQRFLQPFYDKSYQSDNHYLIFPIPNQQLAVNPNLKQNPGY